MAEQEEQFTQPPWLVAVWPGMGNVALGAGGYLVNQLEARLIGELPARELFDVEHVDVNNGVAKSGRLPRNLFFLWRNPAGPDLIIFVGEAQPAVRGYDLCHKLLDYASRWGVERVFTFAAIAAQLHPTAEPRVFGVATSKKLLRELTPHGVETLKEGQISGLNGILLAAAADRGIEGLCLLGELPYFAVSVPSPKASLAVIKSFSSLAKMEIDTAQLKRQADVVEQQLLELMERLGEAGLADEDEEQEFTIPGVAKEAVQEEANDKPEPQLDLRARQRIERMFEKARQDRSQAVKLKQELDRMGVFDKYEDRFLDLFRKAE